MALRLIESFDTIKDTVLDSSVYLKLKCQNVLINGGSFAPRSDISRYQDYTNYCYPLIIDMVTTVSVTRLNIYPSIIHLSNFPISGVLGWAIRPTNNSNGIELPYKIPHVGFTPDDYYYTLQLYRNVNNRLVVCDWKYNNIISGTTVLANDQWYYVELKYMIGSNLPANSIELRINGITEGVSAASVNVTGQDGTTYIDHCYIASIAANTQVSYIDDLYFLDHTGSVNTGFLGDVTVRAYYPDANGDLSQLTGIDSDSVNNYLNIDDPILAFAVDYNSGLPGSADLYNIQNVSDYTNVVYGVSSQVIAYCVSGSDTINWGFCSPIIKPLGGSVVSGVRKRLPMSNTGGRVDILLNDVWDVNPFTSLPWTITGVNTCQWGGKVT